MVNENTTLTETLKEEIIESVKTYRATDNGKKPTAKDTIHYILNSHSNVNFTVEDLKGLLISADLHRSTVNKYVNQLMDRNVIYEDNSGYLHKSGTEVSDIAKYLMDKHKSRIECGKTVIVDFQKEFGTDEFLLNKLDENPKVVFEMFNEACMNACNSFSDDNVAYGNVTIKNLPSKYRDKIQNINSTSIGKLVEFEGIVSSASTTKVMVKKAVYSCVCGKKEEYTLDNVFEKDVSAKIKCSCGKYLGLDENNSEYIDIQEIKLQQPIETTDNPEEPPKDITVFFETTSGIFGGKVNVIGIPFKKKQKNAPVYDIYVYAKYIVSEESISSSPLDETKIAHMKQVVEYCNTNNIDLLDKLSELLIPTIHGYETLRKAILLQQIKGSVGSTRNNIHILLVSDPGLGKSEILRKVSKFPKNRYGSLAGTSGVGLTASMEYIKTSIGDGGWATKPGLLVAKDGGTVALDEITVNDMSNHLLEAMESQTIHIAKAGLTVCLPAEVAVLAACNPKNGRFDNSKDLIGQIELTEPLLDRLDLIFNMNPNKFSRDSGEDLVQKIIENHNHGLSIAGNIARPIIIGEYSLDYQFLRDFVEYARTLRVTIPESVRMLIVEDQVSRTQYRKTASSRLVEKLIRLSTAFAKARLDTEVNEADFKNALELYGSPKNIKIDYPGVPIPIFEF
ncbi:ATP-binding protein [Methanococcus maripaludis]|uniref:Replicative DNA helicase Mcm n=1 Tax=Methanococcus maripaludis TaxID=39152 RepID=A0A8T4H3T1_METMI|nr:ATP-binding protein [Methanococcus maripaludis]MBM7408738.1 replicative DNA helicase Mcm [Methanococcus maripaludis]MBP2219093.1 replicative DNA helicase Mcm [Methanococcus maripaludis]